MTTHEFPSPIGTLRVETDWPPVLTYFGDRLPVGGFCGAERVIRVRVLVGEAEAKASDGPGCEPRHVRMGDMSFSLSREGVEAVIPERSPMRGRGLAYIWAAVPVLCAPEGWEAIHAAAVTGPRGATVIVGESGSGKTARAIELLREGARFLSDDVVLVSDKRTVSGWGCTMHVHVGMAQEVHADTTTLDASGKVQWRPPALAEWGEYPVAAVEVTGEERPSLLVPIPGGDSRWRPQVGAATVLFPPEKPRVAPPVASGRLRVAVANRNPDLFPHEGGDRVTERSLVEGFRAAGAAAEFVPTDAEEAPECDVVLLLHAQFPWSRGPARWGKSLVVMPMTHLRPPREDTQEVVRAACRLLCYSESEAQFYRDLFPEEDGEKFVALPWGGRGVPASLYAEHEPVTAEPDSVVMFGRYHARKNQLGVVRACKRLGMPVTLVGPVDAPDSGEVLTALRTEAGYWPGARFFSWMEQGEALWSFLRRAHVHVNASHFEPFGRVTMEAMAAGCNVVHTRNGWGGEVFTQYGTLCDPENERDIAAAIMRESACTRGRHQCRPPTEREAAATVLAAIEEVLGVGTG